MSRRRQALIASGFTYAQWTLAVFVGFFLTRFLVGALGQELYGTWLATGALFAYASLSDLGILGVMPWLFAEADGAQDHALLKRLCTHGFAIALAGALVHLLVAVVLWEALPSLIHLSRAERDSLVGPVVVLVALTALAYPLRLALAYRQGIQDYSFLGVLGVVQSLLNVGLVVGFSWAGSPLYGVALGASLPGVLAGLIAAGRTLQRDRHLFSNYSGLSWTIFRSLLTSGGGQWLASLGWQLAFASDAVIIGYLGSRESIPIFAITSRLGLTLMQLSWTLPDSTTVGLAQMKASDDKRRVGGVILATVRFHLLAAGFVACAVLAGNGSFVSGWVGPGLFGGPTLNALFALDVVILSAVHAVVTPVGVLGRRMTVGLLTALNGVLHLGFALGLGKIWGLSGVALATALSALLSTLPAGVRLLVSMTSIEQRELRGALFGTWVWRAFPCLFLSLLMGLAASHFDLPSLGRVGRLAVAIGTGGAASAAYLIAMRPVTRGLPLGPRLRQALVSLRLV
jgi:O-antigen/teichoic acid export membrane protein